MTMHFTVMVDWEDDATWIDESAYVQRVEVRSGFDRAGELVAAPGRCVIELDNRSKRFSPGNADGPLYGNLLPRRAVRVQASDGVTTWTLFRGFIDRIQPTAGTWSSRNVTITCVDAITLLRGQRISVEHADSKAVDDAVAELVSSVYTPPATDYDDNGDELTHYGRTWQPEHTTALDALRDVAQAVYGRFFVARDGTPHFRTRTHLQDSSVAAAASFGEPFPLEYYENAIGLQAVNLVAYWPLWEQSGSVFLDESGNGFTGVVHGWSWGETGVGDGYSSALLDGVNDYGELNSSGVLAAIDTQQGTLSAWVKARADTLNDGAPYALMRMTADGNNYLLVYRHNNGINAEYRAGGTSVYAGGSLTDDDWHHVTMTWDTSANALELWLDGTLANRSVDLGTWSGAVADAVLGAYAVGTFHWAGHLAHVGLWDTALSGEQIATLAAVD